MLDKHWSYSGESANDRFVKSKVVRCLEVWDDVELGILEESHFERERDNFFNILISIIERAPNKAGLLPSMPEVKKVASIRTKRYTDADRRRLDLCRKSEESKDLKEKVELLNKAESLLWLVDRPSSMFEIWVDRNGETFFKRITK